MAQAVRDSQRIIQGDTGLCVKSLTDEADGSVLCVVRVFWDQWRPKLRVSLVHLVGLIMRRAGGDASAAFRGSFV